MNKPTPLKVSAPVHRRPLASVEKNREEQRNNPPFPPLPRGEAIVLAFDWDPIPAGLRLLRVQNGSKRQRDLAAVRMADELQLLERKHAEEAALRERGVDPDPCRALRAWVATRRRLRRGLRSSPSTYRLWIKPLRPTGSLGDTLFLTGPDSIRAWTERRYSSLIEEALDGTGFTRISFALAPDLGGER
jgi:hypothetical protein